MHNRYPVERIVQHMFLVPEVIYGTALGGVATLYSYLFCSAHSLTNRGAQFFNDLSLSAVGIEGAAQR